MAFAFLPCAHAIDVYSYSSYPLSKLPGYSMQQQQIKNLKGKYMTLSGWVVKVSANFISKLGGTSSIVMKFNNVNRIGYKYNYARVYLSEEEIEKLEDSKGDAIILEGIITFASSSKTRVEGEMIPAMGMDVEKIWK